MIKYNVKIQNINWFDKNALEAEVVFKLNGKYFSAFCYPCDFKEGHSYDVALSFLDENLPNNTFWEYNKDKKRELVVSEKESWRYYCFGLLKSIRPVIVDCGDLILDCGDWVNDERVVGSYVYFVITRLDIEYLIRSNI